MPYATQQWIASTAYWPAYDLLHVDEKLYEFILISSHWFAGEAREQREPVRLAHFQFLHDFVNDVTHKAHLGNIVFLAYTRENPQTFLARTSSAGNIFTTAFEQTRAKAV